MSTKLGIYNDCCIWLGERKLSALTDAIDIRRTIDAIWDKEVDWCLAQGFWRFAKRTVSITSSTDVTPSFGYANAFAKPSDWIRTIQFSDSDQLDPPLLRVTDESAYWYADVDPLYVQFVSNDETYGGDLSQWDVTFADFVALRLAFRCAPRATQSKTTTEELEALMVKAKKKALAVDSMNNPAKFPPTGSWVRSRGGSRRVRSTTSGMIFR